MHASDENQDVQDMRQVLPEILRQCVPDDDMQEYGCVQNRAAPSGYNIQGPGLQHLVPPQHH